jgi:hypothetical protein
MAEIAKRLVGPDIGELVPVIPALALDVVGREGQSGHQRLTGRSAAGIMLRLLRHREMRDRIGKPVVAILVERPAQRLQLRG